MCQTQQVRQSMPILHQVKQSVQNTTSSSYAEYANTSSSTVTMPLQNDLRTLWLIFAKLLWPTKTVSLIFSRKHTQLNIEALYWHQSKTIEGNGLNNCIYPGPYRRHCAEFQLGLWISANSVGNINAAIRYKRAESNLLADEKGPKH